MTTGASLISVQPYRAPCPRYKCHLSPWDWNRKPSWASCQAVINTVLELYKMPVSLFLFYLFIYFLIEVPLFLSLFLHPPTHVHTGHAHMFTSECFYLWRTTLSLYCRLLDIFSFQKKMVCYSRLVFFFSFFHCVKSYRQGISFQWQHITIHYTENICQTFPYKLFGPLILLYVHTCQPSSLSWEMDSECPDAHLQRYKGNIIPNARVYMLIQTSSRWMLWQLCNWGLFTNCVI